MLLLLSLTSTLFIIPEVSVGALGCIPHSKFHIVAVGGAHALKDGLNDAVLTQLAKHLQKSTHKPLQIPCQDQHHIGVACTKQDGHFFVFVIITLFTSKLSSCSPRSNSTIIHSIHTSVDMDLKRLLWRRGASCRWASKDKVVIGTPDVVWQAHHQAA